MQQLLRAAVSPAVISPPEYSSPLTPDILESYLSAHLDRLFVVDGIRCGFCVGCCANDHDGTLRLVTRNILAADLHLIVFEKYLSNEPSRNWLVEPPSALVHASRFRIIPKKHQPGKWRLIVDLSSPDDFIDPTYSVLPLPLLCLCGGCGSLCVEGRSWSHASKAGYRTSMSCNVPVHLWHGCYLSAFQLVISP